VTGYYQTAQGESMMQARFAIPNFELPQEYMDYVGKEIWRKAVKPYTLYRDFSSLMRDYLDQVIRTRGRNGAENTMKVIRELQQQGIVTLTNDEELALQKYVPMLQQLEANLQEAGNSERIDSLVNAFNENETVKKVYALIERIGEPMTKQLATLYIREDLAALDSVGSDQDLRDIYLARRLYQKIDTSRQPLEPAMLEFAEKTIHIPIALNTITTLNNKYLAIMQRDITKSPSLKTADDVASMSDGEQILRKLIEPYKGRLILLDVWGTWCGPCKEMLSHSQEEYERLKDFDLVYLYLCNKSSDESWKNVIKEYNVLGDNVVHYNLPVDQQSAVEHFLNVQYFPTYKLIDRDGTVLDVNANPRDLEGLARLLEQMK
jgi:thiol-disulfide isomerase/thioredoxin